MNRKKIRRVILLCALLCISIWISVLIFKERINDVYENTIQQISFENIVLENDSMQTNRIIDSLPKVNLNVPSTTPTISIRAEDSSEFLPYHSFKSKNTPSPTPSNKESKSKGRDIKAADLKKVHQYNSRIRLTTFYSQFNDGDYITGTEFANLYRRDPTINKLTKSTICGFIEKNISKLIKNKNTLLIETKKPEGIHTKIKIPFVEDLRINIDNGAEVEIGEVFTSKSPIFNKSVLLPIEIKGIHIVHNGVIFPVSGYISGDYYFIDYSNTKMAYKLR